MLTTTLGSIEMDKNFLLSLFFAYALKRMRRYGRIRLCPSVRKKTLWEWLCNKSDLCKQYAHLTNAESGDSQLHQVWECRVVSNGGCIRKR